MSATKSDVRAVVHDYLEQVWNVGHVDRIGDYVAEDLVQHNPNLPNGREPLARFVASLRRSTPGARFQIRRSISDGDLVVTHSHFTATAEDPGMAVVDIFRVAEGRIVEHWDVKEAVPGTSANSNTLF